MALDLPPALSGTFLQLPGGATPNETPAVIDLRADEDGTIRALVEQRKDEVLTLGVGTLESTGWREQSRLTGLEHALTMAASLDAAGATVAWRELQPSSLQVRRFIGDGWVSIPHPEPESTENVRATAASGPQPMLVTERVVDGTGEARITRFDGTGWSPVTDWRVDPGLPQVTTAAPGLESDAWIVQHAPQSWDLQISHWAEGTLDPVGAAISPGFVDVAMTARPGGGATLVSFVGFFPADPAPVRVYAVRDTGAALLATLPFEFRFITLTHDGAGHPILVGVLDVDQGRRQFLRVVRISDSGEVETLVSRLVANPRTSAISSVRATVANDALVMTWTETQQEPWANQTLLYRQPLP